MKYQTRIFCLLPILLAAGIGAYDLTPDRGALAVWLDSNSTSPYYDFNVYNVGSDNWGPVDNCNTTWSNGQWRGEDGKRIGTVVGKIVDFQSDFFAITNGWFTPNTPNYEWDGCGGSHISRGWDDAYTNPGPSEPTTTTIKPTFHVKLDPNNVNFADENKTNDEIWITTQWNGQWFVPVENIDLLAGSTTLTSHDSLFYGAYSTNSNSGNITITNKNRSNYQTHGDEKLGFQGRRMKVTLTGGAKNSYTIQNGSKVTAEFLGQNTY
jgi:hypothetical protein